MAVLLSTDKISRAGPARAAQFEVERFKTDNYTIRAAKGFNNTSIRYTLSWVELTQAEATALVAQFDATNGVNLVQWTPPFEAAEQNFTVESYNVTLFESSGATYLYQIDATLIKEYDLV